MPLPMSIDTARPFPTTSPPPNAEQDPDDEPPSPSVPDHHPPVDPASPSRGDAFDAFVQASNPNHPDYPIWVERFGSVPRRAKGSVTSASTGRRSSIGAHPDDAVPSPGQPSGSAPNEGAQTSSRSVRRRASAAETRSRYGTAGTTRASPEGDNSVMQNGVEDVTGGKSARDQESAAARAARRARRKARAAEKGKAKAPPPPVPPPRASSTVTYDPSAATHASLPFPNAAAGTSSAGRGSTPLVIPPRSPRKSLSGGTFPPPRTSSVQQEMPPASAVVVSAPTRGARASIDAMVELARSSDMPPQAPAFPAAHQAEPKGSAGKGLKSALLGTFRGRGKKTHLRASPSVEALAGGYGSAAPAMSTAGPGPELMQVQDIVPAPFAESSAEVSGDAPSADHGYSAAPPPSMDMRSQPYATYTSHRLSKVIDVSDTESRISGSRRRSRLVGDDTEDGDEFFDAHSDEGDEGEDDDGRPSPNTTPPIPLRKRKSSLKRKRRDRDSSAAVLPSKALSGAEAALERPDSPDSPNGWGEDDPLRKQRDLMAQAKAMREQQRSEVAAHAAATAPISPEERRRAVYEQNTFFLPASHPMPDLASMESASRAAVEAPHLRKQASKNSISSKLSLGHMRRPSSAGSGQAAPALRTADPVTPDFSEVPGGSLVKAARSRKYSIGKAPKPPAKERQSFDVAAVEKPLPSAPAQPRRPSLNAPRTSSELWHRNLLTEAVGLAERRLGRRPSLQADRLDDMDVTDAEQTIRKTLSPRLLVEETHETDSVGRLAGKAVQESLGGEEVEQLATADSAVGGESGLGSVPVVRSHGAPIESIDEVDEEARRSRDLLNRFSLSSQLPEGGEAAAPIADGHGHNHFLGLPPPRSIDADGASMRSHGSTPRTLPAFFLRSSSASLRRSFSQEQRNLPVTQARSIHSGTSTPVGNSPRLFGGLRAKLGGGARKASGKGQQGISSADLNFMEPVHAPPAEGARHERKGSLAAAEEATRQLQVQAHSMPYTPTASTPTEREARMSFDAGAGAVPVPPLPNGGAAHVVLAKKSMGLHGSSSSTSSEGGTQHVAQPSSTPPTSASAHHHHHASPPPLPGADSPSSPSAGNSYWGGARSRTQSAASSSHRQHPDLRSFEDMLRGFGQAEKALLSEISSKVSSSRAGSTAGARVGGRTNTSSSSEALAV